MKKSCLFPQFAGILLLLLLTLPVYAGDNQLQHKITVEIPEILQMEVGPGEIAFDLAHPNPSEPFPAPAILSIIHQLQPGIICRYGFSNGMRSGAF